MSMDTTETPHSLAFVKATFYSRFQQEETTLQEQLIRLKGPAMQESDRASVIAQCQSCISQLSDLLKDASSYLPAYDQRTYSTAIGNLRDKLQETRTAAAPKRKFAFKKTVPQKDSPSSANDGLKDAPTQGQQASSNVSDATSSTQATTAPTIKSQAPDSGPSTAVIVSSLSHAHYTLPQSSPQLASSASITDCQHIMIDLSITTRQAQAFATMTIKCVTESLLLCGRVRGPVHITSAERSTLVINSRQVRMHECEDCVVYLRCSSRPIIEDCKGIRFAPLPALFDLGEILSPNLWNQVDDFKWLRAEHSPNWSILGVDDTRAITDQAWKEIVAGKGQDLELDDLLRAAKIIT
ncbi:hypothetical protein N7G274_002053 [Stereocaulon virgatum]|uniref:C-CAP/cofactor C-like domain-containing protein n=1 Tax=Stereocaulon virgatum TaxID=373712 RepID=A0ABR4AJJ9_9LECA